MTDEDEEMRAWKDSHPVTKAGGSEGGIKLAEVEIRPARPGDTTAMLEITRNVWGGNDYVPFVWNGWLAASDGQLMAAVLNGRLVGFQHVALHPDGSVWLEGIRVAEEMRGRGVGEALLRHGIAWAISLGAPAVRLSTSSGNAASNRLAEKQGLEVIAKYQPLRAKAESFGGATGVHLALPSEARAVAEYLSQSTQSDGFYTEGWTAYRLTPERLQLLLATWAVVIVEGKRGVEVVAIATTPVDRPSLRVGLMRGEEKGVELIGRWLRKRAAERGLDRVQVMVSRDEAVMEGLQRAGFAAPHEFAMLLHERSLRKPA